MTGHKHLELGAVEPIVRRFPGARDPLALYAALAEDGTSPHTFLLESADRTTHSGERSLIGANAALWITADHEQTTLTALGPNGRAALHWLALELDHGKAGSKLWATWRCETEKGFSNHLHAVEPIAAT